MARSASIMSRNATSPARAPAAFVRHLHRRSRLMDVVGLGASSVDYVNLLPCAPGGAAAETKLRINAHFISCGGQVATMLATCAALGLSTRFLGRSGNGANGRRGG